MASEKKHLKTADFYNMTVNVLWSVICLFPVSIFCYTLMNRKWLYTFLGISVLAYFLPKSFFRKIHVGKTRRFYQKAGIGFFKKFTQNGDIVNNLIKRKYPDYKVVTANKMSIKKLLAQSYMFEQFHFVVFLFFVFAMIYALVILYFWWAVVILITNIIYNIYPILLQQYLRTRFTTMADRIKDRS
ncbi:MAG TPA: hypothetical protein VN726_21895 [Hanamia sp.]|nr:hypothetical protein [Hanamia sp.]